MSASNGTVITFVFDTPGTNHTVAQSSFANPCEPIANGFDSGYTPGPANAGDPPATWNLTITNDAKRTLRAHPSRQYYLISDPRLRSYMVLLRARCRHAVPLHKWHGWVSTSSLPRPPTIHT